MRKILALLILLIVLGAGIAWHYKDDIARFYAVKSGEKTEIVPTPDPETYAVMVEEINYHRQKLSRKYQAARTPAERESVIQSSRNFLELTMPGMMQCWLGTPWDFNGTSTIPGGGQIACGYFVSTIMRDAGFQCERIKLAQQPSQKILRTFLPADALDIKVGTEYGQYMQSIRERDHGIYIIGLDRHVGFVVHNSDGIRFLHSGGIHKRVVNESEPEAKAIRDSRYRVIGNLTGNKNLIKRWLLNAKFRTET